CRGGDADDADDASDSGSADAGDDGDASDGTGGVDGSDGDGDSDGGSEGGDPPSTMPIGIPDPEFGIVEVAPAMPDPWDAPIAGAYYVDNTHANATDDEAATGTPDAPRRTIPGALAAGSTVWIAGGPYDGFALAANGTAEEPVFVTAADPNAPPVIGGGVGLSGSYVVVEYLDIVGAAAGVGIATPSDHVAVRHSEIHDAEGGGSGLYTGRWDPEDDPAVARHIVFWDNFVHDNGDVSADFDEDHHGIALGHHAEHVWILDNEMARNSGDGLQINAKKAYLAETLHHVWVGRNHTHENKQTGLWTKQATDVVFSQNVAWGHRPSNSSEGACIGFQYGPERVWIIFNAVYDCESGVHSSTNVGDEDDVAGAGQDVYILGNVILGIHKGDGSGATTDPWQAGAGIGLTDQDATKHVAFNTIVATDVAFTYARGTGGVELVDNVFFASQGMAINIETSEAAAASTVDHTMFDTDAQFGWGGVVSDLAGLVAAGQCAACLQGDPMFVDAADGDLHLQPGSPAIDAGAPTDFAAIYEGLYGVTIDVDVEGMPRIAGGSVDLGAYERE
ncbi:MAG TPA: choice-of-anchor Q domain-containing protein, partial [Nannocystaceae bacterium]|nr:choice-of-anchor Q domain-containing protein [Nannocystaceae bacterium]